ncbi:MAG: hypothetical protein U0271_25505 [Polyangiaceae bacterium]
MQSSLARHDVTGPQPPFSGAAAGDKIETGAVGAGLSGCSLFAQLASEARTHGRCGKRHARVHGGHFIRVVGRRK